MCDPQMIEVNYINVTFLHYIMRLPVFQKIELFSIRASDETKIRIMVGLVGDLKEGDYHYLQFFNILMRKALSHLELELVGRNFYDAKAKVLHFSTYFSNLVTWSLPHIA